MVCHEMFTDDLGRGGEGFLGKIHLGSPSLVHCMLDPSGLSGIRKAV